MALYEEIYEKFIRILRDFPINRVARFEADFSKFQENEHTDRNKIDYIFKLMEEFNLFPDVASLEEEKNDEKAVEFREEGNAFFKYFKYFKALTLYNKSICYAESMENLSVAIANRSACFFKMEMFPECLESIRLAREVGLPERLTEKMADREAKCKEELKKCPKEEVFVPKIGLPVNEKIPFLAKCLELRENKTFGRHIVTKEDIPAGTYISIEKAYCKELGQSDTYLTCANCLVEVPHRLFPCDNCTQTMFCSKKCQEEALTNFHAIECPIRGSLFKIFNDSIRLIYRMIIYVFSAFPDIEAMGPALEKIKREKKTIFSFDWTKPLTPEDLYAPIHNLICFENSRETSVPVLPYVGVCLILNILQQNPIFSQRFLTTKTAEDILKDIIFRHVMICRMNGCLSDRKMLFKDSDRKDLTFGFAIYGFRSLINHSCAENITGVSLGTSAGLMTTKNIAAGEQIFISYDYNHLKMNRTDRQNELLERYDFHCKCVACVKDFPQVKDLTTENIPEMPIFPSLALSYFYRCSFESAQNIFQMTRNYIQKYGHRYPNYHLYQADVQLRISNDIMCGNNPLEYRERSPLVGLF